MSSKNLILFITEVCQDVVDDLKSAGYRDGYNSAIEGLASAIDCFLEERP